MERSPDLILVKERSPDLILVMERSPNLILGTTYYLS